MIIICRIFYSPSAETDFPKDGIWKFFAKLEKVGGNHGNGIYTFSDDKLYRKLKGMPTNAHANGKMIFHTRLATHGKKAVYNCQPFVNERYIMAHNGVFSGIEEPAYVLGYPRFTVDKYSDSYMMFYVFNKIGILNFYHTFRDKYYGVVLVHDKQLQKTFLLKTGGAFTCAKLKRVKKYIYASSELEFWQHEGEIKKIGSGLFRLEDDGPIRLDEITRTVYSGYGSGYGTIYNNDRWKDKTWDSKTRKWVKKPKTIIQKKLPNLTTDANDWFYDTKKRMWVYDGKKKKPKKLAYCAYCGNAFPNSLRYFDHGYEICMECYEKWVRPNIVPEDENIVGIEKLFGERKSNIPPHCRGCTRADTEKEICTYGGKSFSCKIDANTGHGSCYRHDDKPPLYCYECNWLYKKKCWFGGMEQHVIKPVYDDKGECICNTQAKNTLAITVMCDECLKELEESYIWEIYNKRILCYDCITEIEKDRIINEHIEKECGTCHFEDIPASIEPCASCRVGMGTCDYENWVEKDEQEDIWEQEPQWCVYCGARLADDEKGLGDRWGNHICSGCDYIPDDW